MLLWGNASTERSGTPVSDESYNINRSIPFYVPDDSCLTVNAYKKCTLSIDEHGLKIQGRIYLNFFAKIPRGEGG
jgi:hypothetical protein